MLASGGGAANRPPPLAVARDVGSLVLAAAAAACVVLAIFYVDLRPFRRPVDVGGCDCTCWDGAFKRGYQSPDKYKLVSFFVA